MTIQDYVAFALDKENIGQFVIQNIDTNVVEVNDEGEEVRVKQLVKITLGDQGRLEIIPIDAEDIERQKEYLSQQKKALEEIESALSSLSEDSSN